MPVLRCTEVSQPMSLLGHSRPMHSVAVPINVRCYSNSDIILRRSEVTLRADFVEKVASLKWLQICQNTNDIFD